MRVRIIVLGQPFCVAMVICYIFSNQILVGLQKPLTLLQDLGIIVFSSNESTDDTSDNPATPGADPKEKPTPKKTSIPWVVLNPFEIVILKFKVAGYGGLILALPYIIWQACAFIFPGLKPNERKLIKIILFGCSALGIVGIIVAYFGCNSLVILICFNGYLQAGKYSCGQTNDFYYRIVTFRICIGVPVPDGDIGVSISWFVES
jgi:sec-independent protein translocase protein TatC